MARGWGRNEEDLQADREQEKNAPADSARTIPREEARRRARRHSIELSLSRIREQLTVETHAERRSALEQARRELEEQLALFSEKQPEDGAEERKADDQ